MVAVADLKSGWAVDLQCDLRWVALACPDLGFMRKYSLNDFYVVFPDITMLVCI